jgi:hypothetical protein
MNHKQLIEKYGNQVELDKAMDANNVRSKERLEQFVNGTLPVIEDGSRPMPRMLEEVQISKEAYDAVKQSLNSIELKQELEVGTSGEVVFDHTFVLPPEFLNTGKQESIQSRNKRSGNG